MTLGFSTKWPDRMGELAGQPNCFPEKILSGMLKELEQNKNGSFLTVPKYIYDYGMFAGYASSDSILCSVDATKPKLHTIRHDTHNRWKAGNDIHFVINNRTRDRFQFAPVVKCVAVQEIEIHWFESNRPINFNYGGLFNPKDCIYAEVTVDGRPLMVREMHQLATNDGFDSVEDFFAYFNEPFKGKIIHWTDLKY